MTVEEYLEIREKFKILSGKFFNWGKDKFDYMAEANRLGLVFKGKLVFEDTDEMDNLQDYIIYNAKYKGERVLDLFYDSDFELDDTEEMLLEGMVNSEISIFEIDDIERDRHRCRVLLKDLLNPGKFEIVNVGFAQTGELGAVICTRLMDLENGFYMTTGASFAFMSEYKSRLLADYSLEKFKRRKELSPDDLFVFCNKKRKSYGIKVEYMNYSKNSPE